MRCRVVLGLAAAMLAGASVGAADAPAPSPPAQPAPQPAPPATTPAPAAPPAAPAPGTSATPAPAAAAPEAPKLPADLVGTAEAPKVAWRLGGVIPGSTVVAFNTDQTDLLLVGGPRLEPEAPALGDAAVLSPKGWAIRRLTAPKGLQGLPAMLRRVALAGDLDGILHVWPLGGGDRETSPWKVEAKGPIRVGPLVVGATMVFAGGTTVGCVSDLVEPRWQVDVGGLVERPLASDGHSVFVAAGRTLVALDAKDGAVLWKTPLTAGPQTGLLVTAGLVVGGFDDGTLRAYDSGSGELVWQQKVAQKPFAPHLALAGPWLFAADADGKLEAVDASTGALTWQFAGPCALNSPTIGFGRVFTIGADARLHAIPLDAAQKEWVYGPPGEQGTPEPILGVASIHGPRLYVTTVGGSLVALDLESATGPAPWPVPGGTAARNGRVIPPGEDDEG